jgi:hypothetical protein
MTNKLPAKFPAKTKQYIVAYVNQLNEEFADGQYLKEFYIEGGRKYVKIAQRNGSHNSVHSFVDADGKIWKAATWKAPALNFSRGSIFDENFGVGTAALKYGTR